MSVTTVMLAGVGGQGTILAGDVLARVAVAEGLDVKLAEVHGMAQRGGSVDTVVRFGDTVLSPIVDVGGADHLVGFEMIEAARRLPFLSSTGRLLVSSRTMDPLPVLIGLAPPVTDLEGVLASEGAIFIDAEALACEAGDTRSANVVLLGALSVALDFAEETWRDVIERRVPARTVEINLRAFALGSEACKERECMG